MTDYSYPELNEQSIRRVAKVYEANPDYFDRPDCPYSDDIKEIFKGTAKFHDFDSHNVEEVPDTDSLLRQVNLLSKELQAYGDAIKSGEGGGSASDRNTYFRLSVTLLEKLVAMREKISGIKEYEAFQVAILEVMDKNLTPDQRAAVMGKLENLIKGSINVETKPSTT